MRTAHVSELDFAWGYTSILAHSCGKTNYAKYGVLMNLVLHSSHPWVRAFLDSYRTHRSSDIPCTGIGAEAAVEHSVRADKSAIAIVSEHRLSAVNAAKTALRENERHYHSYLGVPLRKAAKEMELNEDIETLVEQFSQSFGTTWEELKSPQSWSNFANLGVVRSKCGAAIIESSWDGIPGWVNRSTTSCDNHAPPIFEPPDVDDPDFIDLTLDDDDGDDDDPQGGDPLVTQPEVVTQVVIMVIREWTASMVQLGLRRQQWRG